MMGTCICPADAVERFIGTGRDDPSVRGHADPVSERRFEHRRIGVASKQLRVQSRQLGEQGSRWWRAFVAVETQKGRAHGTICESVETTTSVPPAAFTAGITCGSSSRGIAAFTAYPVSPNSRDTVACRM